MIIQGHLSWSAPDSETSVAAAFVSREEVEYEGSDLLFVLITARVLPFSQRLRAGIVRAVDRTCSNNGIMERRSHAPTDSVDVPFRRRVRRRGPAGRQSPRDL